VQPRSAVKVDLERQVTLGELLQEIDQRPVREQDPFPEARPAISLGSGQAYPALAIGERIRR
jgi:hypothetical protein